MFQEGEVRMWHGARHFGFVSRGDGGKDVFIHVSNLPDGVEDLTVGQRLRYRTVQSERHPERHQAVDVELLGDGQ